MPQIVRFTEEHLKLLPQPEQPIDVIGRLAVRFDGAQWHHAEELLATPCQHTYPDDDYDPRDYLNSDDRAAFLALEDGMRIGSVRVYRRWNRNAFIEDIKVDRVWRGRGVGTQLMDAALAWGRAQGLYGAALETQDWNLKACRFYIKYGFELGSVDTRLYDAFEQTRGEQALFFYLLPRRAD
ncbi:MAG TPA: GNAT family N-acetyltransferase [Candidatus Fimadaptatus faecigallinarum]|uniref:GNAT family N-acetyltransferase n=1 Tax=Candidatus Fimadaptatus faecigallinarum TaxID=2840814 RepID=A0A9D1S5N5_9FIRM|nr:GNAT family N-acetyltransferase [Candidatus Fimadaptatus faecigallinarum]